MKHAILKLGAISIIPPEPNTPQAFSDVVKADVEKWAKVIKASGVMAKE